MPNIYKYIARKIIRSKHQPHKDILPHTPRFGRRQEGSYYQDQIKSAFMSNYEREWTDFILFIFVGHTFVQLQSVRVQNKLVACRILEI